MRELLARRLEYLEGVDDVEDEGGERVPLSHSPTRPGDHLHRAIHLSIPLLARVRVVSDKVLVQLVVEFAQSVEDGLAAELLKRIVDVLAPRAGVHVALVQQLETA